LGALGGQVRDWVVLLEAADESGLSTMEADAFRRLVGSWAVSVPTSLYSRSRYALQVTVEAADPADALSVALSLWRDALQRSAVPVWELVRAEVMTPGELELELQAAVGAERQGELAPATERLLGDELLRRALHDGVTGLPNREMFLDEVRRTLRTPVAERAVRAVVAVALSMETGAGAPEPEVEEVSAVVAEHLTAALRRGDVVARVGAAEFAALVTLPRVDHADQLAERVVRSARAAGERLGLSLAASVGVAGATAWYDDPDDLVMSAELAMLAAHQAGGDRHVRFDAVGGRSG
jgi:GGDEF domain-containing protein/uncharacterized protein with GYD domain